MRATGFSLIELMVVLLIAALVLAAGIPAEKIVFSGVGKSAEEIGAALDAGIGQINAESPQEVEAISQIAAARGVQAPVALRVNVDVAPKTHAKISTGQRSTKFGVSTSQNEAAGLYRKMAACLLYTSPSPRDPKTSRMPSSA